MITERAGVTPGHPSATALDHTSNSSPNIPLQRLEIAFILI